MSEKQEVRATKQKLFYDMFRRVLIRRLARIGLPIRLLNALLFPVDMLVLILRVFRDGRFSIWIKLELILAMLYFLVPDDLIPDFLPGIGFLDDILIFLRVAYNLFDTLKAEDEDIFDELWSGNPKTIHKVDRFVDWFGEWATRLIVILTIYKIFMILFWQENYWI